MASNNFMSILVTQATQKFNITEIQIYYHLLKWIKKVFAITRWVSRVEQGLLTLPEYLSSLSVFTGVRVARSLVLCVCFVDNCLSFSFLDGVSSVIYGF